MKRNPISLLVLLIILMLSWAFYTKLVDGVLFLQSLGLAGIAVSALIEIHSRIKEAFKEDA